MALEFCHDEVRSLKDLGSSLLVAEEEIKEVYHSVVRRAAASREKPDSIFVLHFIRRASFVRKSSHREKLLTLLGALQSSMAWSDRPRGRVERKNALLSRFDHRKRSR